MPKSTLKLLLILMKRLQPAYQLITILWSNIRLCIYLHVLESQLVCIEQGHAWTSSDNSRTPIYPFVGNTKINKDSYTNATTKSIIYTQQQL